MDKTLYTLIVHSENIAGLLNQITAVFTRRQINIEPIRSLTMKPDFGAKIIVKLKSLKTAMTKLLRAIWEF